MDPITLATTLLGGLGGGGGSAAPAAPTTFGNQTLNGGNTGLSTGAIIGLAVTGLALVGAVIFFATRRNN